MQKSIKTILANYFTSLAYFYRHLRYRIIVSLALSFGVGLLDGFGLAMFLPLLKLVSSDDPTTNGEGMGGMEFIVEGMQNLGIPLTLESVLIIILVFFTLKAVASFIQKYYDVIVRTYFIEKLSFENINGLANYRYKSFVMADAGRIQNTMSGEMGRVSTASNSYFSMLKAAMMLAVYMGLALLTNPKFAILVVVGGLLSNLVFGQIYKRTKAASSKITIGGHRYQRQLIQFVGHFKYLKSTALLDKYSQKLKNSVVYVQLATKKIGLYNSFLSAVREPLNIAVITIVIILQVYLFSSDLSGIILALLFFYRALNYVATLQTSWNNFLTVSGSMKNMAEFHEELSADVEEYGSNTQDSFRGELELKQVSFNYEETEVIKNVSIHIPSRTSAALVGESGSGKTTLVNIISGLIKPEKGEICIDGIDYSNLDIRSLQKHIGYISQDPVIFSESIYNNVSLWAERTEDNIEQFWKACEKAAIADFIQTLPKGLDTPLGNNGIQLSGGQKQRISIARELYKDVSILIMDEATSALDSVVEREIQKNIDALKGQYTMIIVAHRLSTVQNVDRIYLMNKGEVEHSGDFIELQHISQRFKDMVKLQEL